MLVIACLFLIGGNRRGTRTKRDTSTRSGTTQGNGGVKECCDAAAGPEGNSGRPVAASATNAQRGGGAGPRAATMKSSKQPYRRRPIPQAMLTLAVVMITPLFSLPFS